jgi:hypothetical protein
MGASVYYEKADDTADNSNDHGSKIIHFLSVHFIDSEVKDRIQNASEDADDDR